MNHCGGSQRDAKLTKFSSKTCVKKKQGIPRHPCVSRRKRGCPTAGSPLLSFSCVPHESIFILFFNFYIFFL